MFCFRQCETTFSFDEFQFYNLFKTEVKITVPGEKQTIMKIAHSKDTRWKNSKQKSLKQQKTKKKQRHTFSCEVVNVIRW